MARSRAPRAIPDQFVRDFCWLPRRRKTGFDEYACSHGDKTEVAVRGRWPALPVRDSEPQGAGSGAGAAGGALLGFAASCSGSLDRQFTALRSAARTAGIELIGDADLRRP